MTASTDRYGPGTALVVVDMQNDFVHPDGSLYVSGGTEVVATVNAEIAAARAAGSPVVYTQDWHPPDTPHFVERGGTWPPHCVRDTWGARLHDDLDHPDDALVVRKGTGLEDGYSGFTVHDLETDTDHPTELDRILRDRQITRAVVVGVATDVCVKATALDAARLGYDTRVVAEATAAVELEPGDRDRALAEMSEHGIAISPLAA
jgi:nicotinamidase/pyrazinamidase